MFGSFTILQIYDLMIYRSVQVFCNQVQVKTWLGEVIVSGGPGRGVFATCVVMAVVLQLIQPS